MLEFINKISSKDLSYKVNRQTMSAAGVSERILIEIAQRRWRQNLFQNPRSTFGGLLTVLTADLSVLHLHNIPYFIILPNLS